MVKGAFVIDSESHKRKNHYDDDSINECHYDK